MFCLFRFGTHVSGAPLVQRSLRINNTSPYGECFKQAVNICRNKQENHLYLAQHNKETTPKNSSTALN